MNTLFGLPHADLIIIIAEGVTIAGYVLTNILLLRLLILIGCLGYVIGGFVAGYDLRGETTF